MSECKRCHKTIQEDGGYRWCCDCLHSTSGRAILRSYGIECSISCVQTTSKDLAKYARKLVELLCPQCGKEHP